MKYTISDIQPDGVGIHFPDIFVFDTPKEAFEFAEMVREWYNQKIEENRKKLFENAEKFGISVVKP